MSKTLKNVLLLIGFAAFVVACSSTKEPETNQASVAAHDNSAANNVPAAPAVVNHNAVYFAFDKYDVKEQYNGLVQANGTYLAGNAAAKVVVQGNTDDVGSVEYNLALGQKRADAVKKALMASGANKHQVQSVSNGKLKPKYPNDADASRAQNRRADVVYTTMAPHGYNVDAATGLPMVDASFYNNAVVEGVE